MGIELVSICIMLPSQVVSAIDSCRDVVGVFCLEEGGFLRRLNLQNHITMTAQTCNTDYKTTVKPLQDRLETYSWVCEDYVPKFHDWKFWPSVTPLGPIRMLEQIVQIESERDLDLGPFTKVLY
jgi:hypothetical protein